MITFIIFLLALIVGSFTNVVIDRLNTSLGFVSGRSQCMSCSKDLLWHDLLPIFSFVLLKGRCRFCGSRIGARHVFVELSIAIIVTALYMLFGFSLEILLIILATPILICLSVYDIRHLILPNILVFIFIGLSIISLFVSGNSFSLPSMDALLAGVVAFSFFGILWLISRGRWMGLGDAKLALGMGWFLGLVPVLNSLVYAFWLGAIYSITGIIYMKLCKDSEDGLGMKSLIPFGPFLIVSFYIMIFIPFFVFNI